MSLSASLGVEGGASRPSEEPFQLLVFPFPFNHFTVRSFRGREELSGLYSFDIVVTGPDLGEGTVERLSLGQRALLVLRAGKAPRVFHGIVASVRHEGLRGAHGASQVRMRLVSRLWLLKHRRRSRIFQNQRIDRILAQVLGEANIDARFLLRGEHPVREYCTQYEETDYQFVRRITAEAGIFFHYVQPSAIVEEALAAASDTIGGAAGGLLGFASSAMAAKVFAGETVVFADDASAYPPIDDGDRLGAVVGALGVPTSASTEVGGVSVDFGVKAPVLHYLSIEGTSTAAFDKVTRFEPVSRVRTNTAVYRDYDPERPLAMLTSRAVAERDDGSGIELSASASPGPDAAFRASASVSVPVDVIAPLLAAPELEHYEHHAPFLFPKWRHAEREPALILRQKRRRARVAEGDGTCQALAVGHRFRLEGHPAHHLNRGYVITSVKHEGWATPQAAHEEVYRNTFSAAPDDVTMCPPRPKRRSVLVALTATVVGPASEEIHTDALGQIKVHFHWDREGQGSAHSSCWVRTMQAWGGAGWGTQFIPRIGMEVVVTFEGGDPDKPMVLGCLYNGTHPPSFRLPADKTRSGIRTQSSPGGSGFNELSFEDKVGSEQIYMHAQRDLDEVVERNHTLAVQGDESTRVKGDRREEILGNATSRIGGRREVTVEGDSASQVRGNRIDVTSGNVDRRVSGDLTTRLEGRERRQVTGNADFTYGDDLTTKIHGCETKVVGRHDAERSYLLHVEGVAKLGSTGAMEVTSDKELVLRCGKSSVRITADGIELSTPSLRVKGGTSGLSMADEGVQMNTENARALLLGGKVVLKTQDGASIAMGSEVKLDGERILLNSPEQAKDSPPREPDPTTTLSLVDQDGHPLAHQRYLLILDDGSEQSGILDKDGRAEVSAKASGRIVFPDLSKVEMA